MHILPSQEAKRTKVLWPCLLLLALSSTCAFYLFYHYTYATKGLIFLSDVPNILLQTDLISQGKLLRPHMGVQYTTIAIDALFHIGFANALIAVLVFFNALKVTLLYAW